MKISNLPPPRGLPAPASSFTRLPRRGVFPFGEFKVKGKALESCVRGCPDPAAQLPNRRARIDSRESVEGEEHGPCRHFTTELGEKVSEFPRLPGIWRAGGRKWLNKREILAMTSLGGGGGIRRLLRLSRGPGGWVGGERGGPPLSSPAAGRRPTSSPVGRTRRPPRRPSRRSRPRRRARLRW